MKKLLFLGFILFSSVSFLFAQIGATGNTNAGGLPNFGTAFGSGNDVLGQYALVGGSLSRATGSHSFGFGYSVQAIGEGSFAMGRSVFAKATNSWIIGTGVISNNFENTIDNSFMIGFNASQPSFFVESFTQAGGGFVGIHTTAPRSALDVSGKLTTDYFRMTDGAVVGHVLTAIDVDGNMEWRAPDGGGMGTPSNYWSKTGNMVYYNLGNVGIGLINPYYKLDVLGQARIKQELVFNGGYDAQITFGSETSGKKFTIKSLYNGGGAGKTSIRGLCVDKWGNVGIGTDSPGFEIALDVKGITRTEQLTMVNGASTGKIMMSTNNFGAASWVDMQSLAGAWSVDGNNVYRESGSVGIGTSNVGTTHKLVVAGSINATLIKVTESVPSSDYVFEEDYSLMDLTELETFVKTNKHLPEVMSADEFAKNGYSLGEMDDVLLRKVEELTLYVIDQDKAIKQQQKLLKKQQKLIDQLLQKK